MTFEEIIQECINKINEVLEENRDIAFTKTMALTKAGVTCLEKALITAEEEFDYGSRNSN